MTRKRDLKRLVRERQEKTGESYTTARRRVIARGSPPPPAPPPQGSTIPVVEMISLSAEARRLGLRCRVAIASTLAARVDPTAVLERVRDALRATADDPGTGPLRAAALRGEAIDCSGWPRRAGLRGVRQFVARALAGIGGVSDEGNMMALPVDGPDGAVMVIAHIGFRPAARTAPPADGVPRLVLTTVDQLTSGPDQLILAWIP